MKVGEIIRDDKKTGEFLIFCPACQCGHVFNTTPQNPNGMGGFKDVWTFNGDFENPTFRASMLVTGTQELTEEEYQRVMSGEKIPKRPTICHSFVTDGKIEFLGDCTHNLAGQTVDLEDV